MHASLQALTAVLPSATGLADQLPSSNPFAVVDFWRAAGSDRWFAKDPAFDRHFRDLFLATHEAAARGDCGHWRATAIGALALLLLLDQFPRNAFRGTPRMYATDEMARAVAQSAVAVGQDWLVETQFQLFFYLPFGHSEDIADQERSVALAGRLDDKLRARAEHHRDIVRRFGRFPHRNPILGRAMTPDEQRYLDDGGYAG
jgi:uncharacterized protein (DUF924 family)